MKLVKDVASELKISKSVIKEMIKNKKIPYEFKNGTYYVNAEDVTKKLNTVTNNNPIKVQDKLFLKYINITLKDFKHRENFKKNETVRLLLKELLNIKKTKTFNLLNTFELSKYLSDCLINTDYSPVPQMEAEHQYMYDYLSTYFTLESVGSGGFIYSPSNEVEAMLPTIKSQLSEETHLTDLEMLERLEAFLSRGISMEESEFDSLDDLFR